ncbi:NAD(P)-dependent oxidoreductase [Curtobacterium sp. SL109]|uniref:NAD(P)-dependent oxidoreductase n=1 Tax=Curtobacterium sp. SL109 TaxID=2994662 RepID=UPI0022731CDA|nr:NAD(P)H-binding protein [Curtobacterium sp. SL109]MCY1693723.1 NAD(P)H-binding protein [Curtobacterium sp. SL109]
MSTIGNPSAESSNSSLALTVFGANGGTGAAAVQQALTAGHRVTAVTRHPEQFSQRHERLTVLKGDATVEADVLGAVAGADAVLSALGVPYSRNPISLYSKSARAIVMAMEHTGIRRLIVVTSSAVDPDGFPATSLMKQLVGKYLIGPVIHRLGRTMYEDMVRMEEIIRSTSLDWTILRPPALFNKDAVGAVETSLRPMTAQFVARQDLGAIMVDETTRDDHHRETVYVRSVDGRPSIIRTIWDDAIRKK